MSHALQGIASLYGPNILADLQLDMRKWLQRAQIPLAKKHWVRELFPHMELVMLKLPKFCITQHQILMIFYA